MKVRSSVRAGALYYNHNAAKAGIKVRTGVRAGTVTTNPSAANAGAR